MAQDRSVDSLDIPVDVKAVLQEMGIKELYPPQAKAAPLALEGKLLVDWGGAQRWLFSDVDAGSIRDLVAGAGGHATLFRGGDRQGAVFQPLSGSLVQLHKRLKEAFDPGGVFNPGRLYAEF